MWTVLCGYFVVCTHGCAVVACCRLRRRLLLALLALPLEAMCRNAGSDDATGPPARRPHRIINIPYNYDWVGVVKELRHR